MQTSKPQRLLLASALLAAACSRHGGDDRAWGTPLVLDGARNEVIFAVAEETHVPPAVLLALAFEQSRFEDPELVFEEGDMDGAAEMDADLVGAPFPMDDERLAEEPDFELEDDLSVPGLEDMGEALASDPAADAFVLSEETAVEDPVEVPEGIDPTSEEPSDDEIGDPHPALDAAGVFYLTSDQVTWAARRLSVDEDDVRTDLEVNTRAAAALLLGDLEIDRTAPDDASHSRWEDAMVRFVGLDPLEDAGVLMHTELHAILHEGFDHTTSDGERLMMVEAGLPIDAIDLSSEVPVDEDPVSESGDESGVSIEALGGYPAIEWIAAASSNYTHGRSSRVRYVVIHDIEGTMPGAIATFRNPSRGASAHYIIRSRDGHIVQMVRETDTAWHAGHWLFNSAGIGIEHEGFAYRPRGGGYYTSTLYRASAELTCAIARRYDIPVDRRHVIGHANVPSSRSSTTLCPDDRPCGGISHHTDPGRYWDWRLYMSLVSACVGGREVPSGDAPRPPTPAMHRAITTGWGGQQAVTDADGALHVFAVDARHRLVENVRSGSSFSGFRVIAGASDLHGYPAAIRTPSGDLYVAVRGDDDRLHLYRRTAGAWGSLGVLDGLEVTTMPSLFVNPDGRVEVFVRGADRAAWHAAERSPGGEWGRWWSLGGDLRSMVTVTANRDGSPHVFAIGDNVGHVFHRFRTAPTEWSGWRYLGARGNTPVSPITMPDGRLAVFVRNAEGRLVQQFQDETGEWRRPITVGGSLTSNVVAVLDGRGRVNVFSRGRDGALFRVVRNAGGRWGAFARLGGRATMGPAVVLTSRGLEVFVAGRNHALYQATQSSMSRTGWSGWHGRGGNLGWL